MLIIKLYATITMYYNKKSVVVEWINNSMYKGDYFVLEKSMDGKSFKKIGKINNEGVPGQETFYMYEDKCAPEGSLYYRLKNFKECIISNTVVVDMKLNCEKKENLMAGENKTELRNVKNSFLDKKVFQITFY